MCCTYALYVLSTVHPLLNGRQPQVWQSQCCVRCVTFLYINFSSTPTSILSLTTSYTEFNDIFRVGKYCQLFTHKSIIDQYAISALYSPQTAPSLRRSPPNLIHPYRARPHSPPQTASGSNQPCCHCSHVRTDRWDDMVSNISALLCYADSERRANNITYRMSAATHNVVQP